MTVAASLVVSVATAGRRRRPRAYCLEAVDPFLGAHRRIPGRIRPRQRIVADVRIRIDALAAQRVADDRIHAQEPAQVVVEDATLHVDQLHRVGVLVTGEAEQEVRDRQRCRRAV